MNKDVLMYMLENFYGITNVDVDIDEFNRRVQEIADETMKDGIPYYEGEGLVYMSADAEVLQELLEANMTCVHRWKRTGEALYMDPLIYIIQCEKCDVYGKEHMDHDGSTRSIKEDANTLEDLA